MLTYHEPQMKYCRNMNALSLILSEVCMAMGLVALTVMTFARGEKQKVAYANLNVFSNSPRPACV